MSECTRSTLSPVQQRIIAAGATAFASVCLIATALALFLVLQRFSSTFRDVFLPLAIATILATLLRPIITQCETHTRLSRTQGIVLLYLIVLLLIGVAIASCLPFVISQITGFIEEFPILRDNVFNVLPLAYFQDGGGTTLIGLCAIVFIIGQMLTDYVFTPRMMGDKTGMGPMLIIFSVFFWGVALGGPMGIILAIPLTAFFLIFWRLLREHYLPALTAKHSEIKS